jgi:hypothetical protein
MNLFRCIADKSEVIGRLDVMPSELENPSIAKAAEPRVVLGGWLKSLRMEQGLSQRQLAEALSLDYYTFVSQLETGRGKIPSSRYLDWANALGQDPKSFMIKLLKYYEPEAYSMIFGDREQDYV